MFYIFYLLLVFAVGGRCADEQRIIFKLDDSKTSTGRSTSRWYEIHFSTITPLSDAILPIEPIKVTTGFVLTPAEVIISKPKTTTSPQGSSTPSVKTKKVSPKRISKPKISDVEVADALLGDARGTRREGISKTPVKPVRVRKTIRPSKVTARKHKVKMGDTLLSLSKQYYNNPKQWIKIYRANKEKIIKGILKPGIVLIIP